MTVFKGFNIATENTLKSILQVVYNNFARRKDVVKLKQNVKNEVMTELSDFNKELTDDLKAENQKTVQKIETLENSVKEKADVAGFKAKEISDYAKEVQENFAKAQKLQQATEELQASAAATEEKAQTALKEFKRIRDNLSTAVLYKGTIETYADLPKTANFGWMYNIKTRDKEHEINAGDNLIWNGEAWDNISNFFNAEEILESGKDASFGKLMAKTIKAETVTSNLNGTASRAIIAETASDAKTWNGLINDVTTENNEDTWVLIHNVDKIQHTTREAMTVGAANKLCAARNIELKGAVSGNVNFDGSENVNIETKRRSVHFTQSSPVTNQVWFRVARCELNDDYIDANITFHIRDTFSSINNGILAVKVRSSEGGVFETADIAWSLSCDYYNYNDFVLLHNEGTAPTVAEIWTRIPNSWEGRTFTVIDEGSRTATTNNTWVLANDYEGFGETSYTPGMIVIKSWHTGRVGTALSLADPTGKASGLVNDYGTENNEDTWIPVLKDGKIQHTEKLKMTVGGAVNIDNQQPRLANGTEYNEIAIHDYANGTLTGGFHLGEDGASIKKAIDFDWYDTRWSIGNIRGNARDSLGFGFAYKENKNDNYSYASFIGKDGLYHGEATGLKFYDRGNCYIHVGPNDNAYGPGDALNNMVISSWWGISFTTSCEGMPYTNKTAVSIDCRNGDFRAPQIYGTLYGKAEKLMVKDTRFTNSSPKEYMDQYGHIAAEFKQKGSIGLNVGDINHYCGVITMAQWCDASGGLPSQLAMDSETGRMYCRWGISNFDWSGWQTVAFLSDIK